MRWTAFKEEMKEFFHQMKELWPVWSTLLIFLIAMGGIAIWNNHRISQLPTLTLIKEQWECSDTRSEIQVYAANVVSFDTVCIEYRRK